MWSVSCTLLLMMKNYNNLFQQTTITQKKLPLLKIYIKNISRFLLTSREKLIAQERFIRIRKTFFILFPQKDVSPDTLGSEILACIQYRAGFSSLYLYKHFLRDTKHVFVDYLFLHIYLHIPVHTPYVYKKRRRNLGFLFIYNTPIKRPHCTQVC